MQRMEPIGQRENLGSLALPRSHTKLGIRPRSNTLPTRARRCSKKLPGHQSGSKQV